MMDQRRDSLSQELFDEDQANKGVISSFLKGSVQLVYISPKSLVCNPVYRNMLLAPVYKEKLVAFVLDETYCVESWQDNITKKQAIFYSFGFL